MIDVYPMICILFELIADPVMTWCAVNAPNLYDFPIMIF